MTEYTVTAEDYLTEMQRQVDVTAGRLVDAANGLRDEMQRLSEKVGDRGDYSVNELGEVQGRGFDVDRLCVKLRAQMDSLETAQRAVATTEA
jgi:chlorite dismutase